MADNDDLMLEVTASTEKADSGLKKLLNTLDGFQTHIDKICPSLAKFTEKLDSIASTSKAFAALEKLTKGTTNFSAAAQKSEEELARHNSRMALFNAQMERANAIGAKAKAQQDSTALSVLKTEKSFEALASAEQKAADSADSPAFQKFLNTPQEGFPEPKSRPVSPSMHAVNQKSQDDAAAFWANADAKS
jgi:chromosome segregation ATPase